jgi:hypothetical protein
MSQNLLLIIIAGKLQNSLEVDVGPAKHVGFQVLPITTMENRWEGALTSFHDFVTYRPSPLRARLEISKLPDV